MSTNKSEHLQLHLWEPGDSVLRTEFNENWEKLDASAAQAQADLTAGLAEVQTSLAVKHFAVGTYSGSGGTQTVKLGFKPAAVLVFNQRIDMTSGFLCGLALSGQPAFEQYNSTKLLILTSTGFQTVSGSNASLNTSGYKYNYIAVA